MRILLSVLVLSSLVLAGCGGFRDSRANPANWFGKSKSKTVVATEGYEVEEVNPLIAGKKDSKLVAANATSIQKSGILRRRDKVVIYEGTLVDQVTDLRIERTSSGAIVHATAQTVRQGSFDVRLVPDGEPANGVQRYELRAYQLVSKPQGPARTRTYEVAEFISKHDLDEISTIEVRANRNVRSTRRR